MITSSDLNEWSHELVEKQSGSLGNGVAPFPPLNQVIIYEENELFS